jgi:tetratricopeptide (TPR) repeat protein
VERSEVFIPIDRMWKRVDTARDDSTALFYSLMHLGELLTKTITAGLVAAVSDERERHRYRLLHGLVRADSLGEWSQAVQQVLKPPVAEFLPPAAQQERQELTQRSRGNTWQYDAVSLLRECCKQVNVTMDASGRLSGQQWLLDFVRLRNKTRGHGAQSSALYGKANASLEESIRLLMDNFRLFQRPWAYVYLTQSMKYDAAPITPELGAFEAIMTGTVQDKSYQEGLYVYFDEPNLVELISSDPRLTDFYYPNGSFNDTKATYEEISYISGEPQVGDARAYMSPAKELPSSSTTGFGKLRDEPGRSFTNMPPCPNGYVVRRNLEVNLKWALTEARDEIITLSGRGGIGKTFLALSVLHGIADKDAFDIIIWFSARDVDLETSGPKLVKPDVLTVRDVAREFVRLMEPEEEQAKEFDPVAYFREALTEGAMGGSTLFIFDNFETVRDKGDVYQLISNSIRRPNKALITTRERYFRGDYELEVGGMEEEQAQELISATGADLEIDSLLTPDYRRQLFEESEGHPYVIKILLGEVAKSGVPSKVERIMASKDRILEALFERTYNKLSPHAQRVFLTLCNWRSVVPQLALEAVLLRNRDDYRIDVSAAVAELRRSSFINVVVSPADNEAFLSVPLTAYLFGKSMLPVSPFRSKVQADTEMLRAFGATQLTDIQHGIAPNVRNLLRKVESERDKLADYLPILEVVSREYPPAWRLMVSFYQRSPGADSLEKAKRSVEQYLYLSAQSGDDDERREAWKKLAELRKESGEYIDEVQALTEMTRLPGCPIEDVSYTARKLLNSLKMERDAWGRDEKLLLLGELADRMESRIAELYPNDFGYLAWLRWNRGERELAEKLTRQGLRRDPHNKYLSDLAARLGVWA